MKLLEKTSYLSDRSLKAISLRSFVGMAVATFCLPVYTAQAAPPELERLQYFEGSWTCQQPADSTEPSGEFIWNVDLGLNDFWYLGSAKQTQTPADGQAIDSQEFLGYDSAAGKLVRSVVVSNGNSYNVTANDWDGNSLIWQGMLSIQGKSAALRQEMTKDSQNRFTTTYFILDKEDSWLPVVQEGCERQT